MKAYSKIVGLTAIGGALEFYDFTIYALFAPYVSHNFFPSSTPLIGIMNTFAVFALGYLARPLGGIFFGHLGDTLGRKTAFSLSVFIMATATLLMGCLPTYQSIGSIAPMMLIGLRLIQGFSVGGEIPGAAVFTIEHVPREKRGVSIGLVFMSITLGNTFGAAVGLSLTILLSPEQMMLWGWRIPFIIGFSLGIISYIIRKKAAETPVFTSMVNEEKLHRVPYLSLLKTSPMRLLNAIIMTAVTSSILSLFLYLPTYLTSIIKLDISHAYLINIIGFFSFGLMTALFGHLSDYINRKQLLTIGAWLLILFSYPLFYGLTTFGGLFIWVFTIGFAVLGGLINGCYVVIIVESFPASFRYSGVGFSYGLGLGVFGGIAPLAFTWLIHVSNITEAPAFYILACATLTLLAILSRDSHKNNKGVKSWVIPTSLNSS